MHRAIAAWLTEHPWRPIVAIAFCGALAQMLLPFTLLACAIPVLTVLRFDARLGLAAAAVGAAVQCGIVFSLAPTVWLAHSRASCWRSSVRSRSRCC